MVLYILKYLSLKYATVIFPPNWKRVQSLSTEIGGKGLEKRKKYEGRRVLKSSLANFAHVKSMQFSELKRILAKRILFGVWKERTFYS